jgi:hypothetical protein
MLGHTDIIMRQEQYQDLLREAAQERLIQTEHKSGPSLWGLRRYLAEMFRARISLEYRLIRLKSAHS